MILRSKFLSGAFLFGSIFLVSSCMETEPVQDTLQQLNKEVAAIDAFLALNGTTAIKDLRGVRMVVEDFGEGLPARGNSVIDIDYVGRLFNPSLPNGEGAIFDQGNIDETNVSTQGKLTKLIQGWQIALTQLPVGAKARLYIPSYWAYGNQANGSIPANSTLIFDIEFNEIVFSPTMINQWKTDTTAIETYLETKGITNYETDTLGVRYTFDQGDGSFPFWYNKVKFSYKYYLLTNDQTVISEGIQEPNAQFSSRVVDYLQGISIGLLKIREGGSITVYVPSLYCFGPEGAKDNTGTVKVPPNSTLIIKIDFDSIVP